MQSDRMVDLFACAGVYHLPSVQSSLQTQMPSNEKNIFCSGNIWLLHASRLSRSIPRHVSSCLHPSQQQKSMRGPKSEGEEEKKLNNVSLWQLKNRQGFFSTDCQRANSLAMTLIWRPLNVFQLSGRPMCRWCKTPDKRLVSFRSHQQSLSGHRLANVG